MASCLGQRGQGSTAFLSVLVWSPRSWIYEGFKRHDTLDDHEISVISCGSEWLFGWTSVSCFGRFVCLASTWLEPKLENCDVEEWAVGWGWLLFFRNPGWKPQRFRFSKDFKSFKWDTHFQMLGKVMLPEQNLSQCFWILSVTSDSLDSASPLF